MYTTSGLKTFKVVKLYIILLFIYIIISALFKTPRFKNGY